LIIKLYDEEMADESQDFWYVALPYLLALCVGSGAMWTHAEAILAGWDNAWLRGSRRAIASEIDRGVIDENLIARRGPLQYEQHQTLSWRTHLAVRFNGPSKGSWCMPLTRGKAVGYDAALMTFKFTMRNGQKIVQCQISIAALSDLADRRRGSTGDLFAEFNANRELIEAIASVLFDRSSNVETRVVSIFSKHIRRGRFGRLYSARRRPRRTVK